MDYSVLVRFSIGGLVGAEHVLVQASNGEDAEIQAHAKIEDAMIALGLATFECGCCLMASQDGGDVDSMEMVIEGAFL